MNDMILSISGIDGSGKTSLIKLLKEKGDFFVPDHVSVYATYPENIVEWYTKGDIDEVVALDLKAFAKRNEAVKGHRSALLDRGYHNVINSACARHQERSGISYQEAFDRVARLNKSIGFERVEEKSVLLHFLGNWEEISPILIGRVGELSDQYLGYLKILYENMKTHLDAYDLVLDATKPIENNLQEVLSFLK